MQTADQVYRERCFKIGLAKIVLFKAIKKKKKKKDVGLSEQVVAHIWKCTEVHPNVLKYSEYLH